MVAVLDAAWQCFNVLLPLEVFPFDFLSLSLPSFVVYTIVCLLRVSVILTVCVRVLFLFCLDAVPCRLPPLPLVVVIICTISTLPCVRAFGCSTAECFIISIVFICAYEETRKKNVVCCLHCVFVHR